jgi:glycerol kinase
MPELILGLDVGTSSARAMVVDLSGKVHGRAQAKLIATHPAPGLAEQDPWQVWKSVEGTIGSALADAGREASDLATIGLTTQRSSVVVWDRQTGKPLSPLILWTDLRGVKRSAELEAAGFLSSPLAAVSKLESAVDGIEGGRGRANSGELVWGTLDSYILHCLSEGAIHATDYSSAWSTCYLNTTDFRSWNDEVLSFQGLDPSLFPDLCDTYGDLGRTSAARVGAEVPIGAVIADQQSGMFAHDAWETGAWKATYGTSATLMIATGQVPVLEGPLTPMLQSAKGNETLFASEGMVVSAGGLLDWLVQDMGLFSSVEELAGLAASVSDSGGVSICPALQGLGAPHNDASRRASIVGLSGASTRSEIARAALESIAFRMREVADSAESIASIEVPESLRVDGGLAVNDLFLQIQANLLGRPVERHSQIEATALGACVAAAIGSKMATRSEVSPLTGTNACFEPVISQDEADARFTAWAKAVALPDDT